MYLGGIARTRPLYVTTMEPLLGLIGFQTSREFDLWFDLVWAFGPLWNVVMVDSLVRIMLWDRGWGFQNLSLVGGHDGTHWLVLVISPSSELRIVHRFFCWIPYSSRNIWSKFENYSQPLYQMGNRLNRFDKFSQSVDRFIGAACERLYLWHFWCPFFGWFEPKCSK